MRWTMDTFSPSLASTVGVNFKSRRVHVCNEFVQVQVWDTAGQEQFHKITTSFYKGAQGIMLVYDVTDPSSLANVEYWIKNIKSHASDTVQVALIGNKTDLRVPSSASTSATASTTTASSSSSTQYTSSSNPNSPTASPASAAAGAVEAAINSAASGANNIKHWCDTERGQEVALKFGIPFFETSAKESHNVDIAFLTLVEHIIVNGGTHTASGLGASSGGLNSSGSGAGGGGLDRRSIVEKAEKPRLFNINNLPFRRNSFSNAKNPPPPPPPSATVAGTAGASTTTTTTTEGGVDGAAGAGGGTNDPKEKCIIS